MIKILHTGDIHLGDLAGPTRTAQICAAKTPCGAWTPL